MFPNFLAEIQCFHDFKKDQYPQFVGYMNGYLPSLDTLRKIKASARVQYRAQTHCALFVFPRRIICNQSSRSLCTRMILQPREREGKIHEMRWTTHPFRAHLVLQPTSAPLSPCQLGRLRTSPTVIPRIVISRQCGGLSAQTKGVTGRHSPRSL